MLEEIAHAEALVAPGRDRLKDMVREALGSGLTQGEVLQLLHEYGDKYPEYAARVDTNDDLEIDEGSELYSYGEDGVWVQVWVHVPHPPEEDTE